MRWDLIIGGMERGTAFSELIDPVIQRERLTAQSLLCCRWMTRLWSWMRTCCAPWSTVHPPMVAWSGYDRLIMLLAGDQDPERRVPWCVSPVFVRPFLP